MLVLEALLVGLLTTIVAWYANFLWTRKRMYELADKFDGPKGFPLFGNALDFYGEEAEGQFRILHKHLQGTKSACRVWMGPYCLIFLNSPQDIQTVLNSPYCVNKSKFYDVVPNKTGLLTAKADVWKIHRKFINPSFHTKILHSLIPIFNEKAKVLVEVIDKHVGKGEFDVFHKLSACTLETLFETAIGLKKDVQNDSNNQYLNSTDIAGEVFSTKMVKLWCQIECIYKYTKTYKDEQKHVINGIFTIADQILEEKTKLLDLKIDAQDSELDENFEFKTPQIFIDQLLKLRKILRMDEIKDEINTFIGAGHETSALTLSAFLLMMAMNPNVQEKVVEELQEVCDKNNMDLDNVKLSKLKYTEMCVKETMRLFPVLPFIARHSDEEIEIGNQTIPKGVSVFVPIFEVQRNPEIWGKDAGDFNPERFLPENISKIHPYANIPFGGGPRICIGMRYAMLNMKSIVAYLMLNFKFTTSLKYNDLTFKLVTSLKVVQQYKIKVERR